MKHFTLQTFRRYPSYSNRKSNCLEKIQMEIIQKENRNFLKNKMFHIILALIFPIKQLVKLLFLQ